jgi:hypothetical protein
VDTLPGLEAGKRTEHTEYRVVVTAGINAGWIIPCNSRSAAEATAAGLVSTTRIESRQIVTYTDAWRRVDR